MLSACCLALVLFAPPTGPLFAQTGTRYTGLNGYEDLLVALERIYEPAARRDMAWLRWAVNPGSRYEPRRPAGRQPGMTVLQVRRAQAAYWKLVVPHLRDAVRKGGGRVFIRIDWDVLFPELAAYRDLAVVAAADMYVAFAEGRAAQAIETLELLSASQRFLDEMNLFGGLAGAATESIVFAELDRVAVDLDAVAAQRLLKLAEQRLSQEPRLVLALRSEQRWMLGMEFDLADPDMREIYLGAVADFSEAEMEQLRNLSPQQMNQLANDFRALAKREFESILSQAERPEHQWGAPLPVLREPSLAGRVAETLRPVAEQVWAIAAAERARWRLTRLYALAALHRWETGKRPTALGDFAPKEMQYDPLADRDFEFFASEDTFLIRSAGSRYTGLLTLRGRIGTLPSGAGMP